MQVICLEKSALYALVEQVVERLREKHNEPETKWGHEVEAMKLLNVKSARLFRFFILIPVLDWDKPNLNGNEEGNNPWPGISGPIDG